MTYSIVALDRATGDLAVAVQSKFFAVGAVVPWALAGPGVVDGLADTFVAGGRPFPELLVACLAAADAQGGDRRGRESAALYVARRGGGYGGGNDRWIDLRVDDHTDPIGELGRLLGLQRLYLDRPADDDLVRVDETVG